MNVKKWWMHIMKKSDVLYFKVNFLDFPADNAENHNKPLYYQLN
jgi:hypothetical protein